MVMWDLGRRALTATTGIIPMRARLMATMGLIGSREACSSELARGSMASTGVAGSTGPASTGVVRSSVDAAGLNEDSTAVGFAVASYRAPSSAAARAEASTVEEVFMVEVGFTAVADSTEADAGNLPGPSKRKHENGWQRLLPAVFLFPLALDADAFAGGLRKLL
jgi:hypothetical protein